MAEFYEVVHARVREGVDEEMVARRPALEAAVRERPSTRGSIEPEQVLGELLALDPGLKRERYWGEDAVFFNPRGQAPLGVILAAIKDHDGPNDRSAELDRPSVYRFAFGMAPATFERRFGPQPERPPKGGVIDLPGYDPTRVGELMPHPVYGWMSWVQILAPTAVQVANLRSELDESLELTREKWQRRA